MNLFRKSINTVKADPLREMRDAINAAIDTARKAGIGAAPSSSFWKKIARRRYRLRLWLRMTVGCTERRCNA